MFDPVRMNSFRPTRTQLPMNRDPFMFQNAQRAPSSRSPLIFSKFLPGNLQQYATLGKGGAGGLTNILNNVQQVLRVVETTAPIVKEYGPMIKNLPAMYRMVKAVKGINGLTDEDEGNNIEDTSLNEEDKVETTKSEKDTEIAEIVERKQGVSTPKLYI